jgi:hypothetical protein
MTVKDIIEKYLRENGVEGGLAGEDCGCGIDDLAPCCEPIPAECVPAYRVVCDGHPEPDEDGEIGHECSDSPHEMFTPTKPEGRLP